MTFCPSPPPGTQRDVGIPPVLLQAQVQKSFSPCYLVSVHNYYVYIMTNSHHTVLYTGVTNDLIRRSSQHKLGIGSKSTATYHAHLLVYYEWFTDINSAIHREKQIKSWSRKRKLRLINQLNPEWRDLSEELFGDAPAAPHLAQMPQRETGAEP